ncbi:MAG: hypothetical protein JSR77_06440 [Planctomycetes bacterium]|nr:hypothetical protein [Planctomycetota bacterium]
MNRRVCMFAGVAAAALLARVGYAQSVDNAFTYQGEVQNLGVPADGLHDLRFSLFGSATGPDQIGSTLCVNNVEIRGGRFTVSLDFGPQFSNATRFLQLEVRADIGADCSDPSGFQVLNPRQELTAAPLAAFSLNAGLLNGQNSAFYLNASNLTAGTIADTRLSGNVAKLNGTNVFTGPLSAQTFAGDGAALVGLNAANISAGALDVARLPSGGAWSLASNLNIDGGTLVIDQVSNRVGIGTSSPSATLSVAGPISVGSIYSVGNAAVHAQGSHIEWNKFGGDGSTFIINQKGLGAGGIRFGEIDNANNFNQGMVLAANGFLTVTGRVSASTVEIRGGADIVEGFTASEALEPGTVVVIDAAKPGDIAASTAAYDSKVVGIVSGANGVNPGMKLGHEGVLDGEVQVAMTGRVYVKCSAENGAIAAGDRLTTASLRGHAMKVTDSTLADGAVIGKAMGTLDSGTGFVLVVVNLQ